MPKPKSVLQIQAVWRIMPQFLAACVAPRLFWLVPGKERKHLHLHLQHHPMKTQIDSLIIHFFWEFLKVLDVAKLKVDLILIWANMKTPKVSKGLWDWRATSRRVDGDLNRIYHVWSKHFFTPPSLTSWLPYLPRAYPAGLGHHFLEQWRLRKDLPRKGLR